MDEKCMMVVFGATGDLMKRKLVPALLNLYEKGALGKDMPIACVGRRPFTDKEYISALELAKFAPRALKKPGFLKLLNYHQLDFGAEDHKDFRRFIKELEKRYDCSGNKIFYLAMPPELFRPSLRIISRSGVLKGRGWDRIVFEKPFGRDLKSARALNRHVARVFKEKDIYRIDHYLGKELVQNIMVFRFANSIFEQIWSNKYIDQVQITLAETDGVGTRAGYYESSGAIRDMLENHVLQVLTLTAMEPPAKIDADTIRDMKVKVLKSIRPISKNDLVLGQYTQGVLDGKKLPAYRKERGVDPRSDTETFASIKLLIDNPRWKGVPFYIRTGKRMAKKYAEVNLVLKDVTCHLFCGDEQVESPNVITIRIQPDEGIGIKFNSKYPGPGIKIHPVLMDFCHTCLFGLNTAEAYETLLHEIMVGDQTLFTRWDEVDHSWRLIDPILRRLSKKRTLSFYKAGSWGPKESAELLKSSGRDWLPQGEQGVR